MTPETLWSRIAEIVVEFSDDVANTSALDPEMSLIDDLGLSSLMIVNLIIEMETAFDVTLEESDFKGIVTVNDIVDLAAKKLGTGSDKD